MREGISCRELQLWKAYNEIEPFGEERADLRSAIVAQAIVMSMTGEVRKLSDFMPDFERRTESQQSVEEMQNRIKLAVQIAERKKTNGKHDGSCRLADR